MRPKIFYRTRNSEFFFPPSRGRFFFYTIRAVNITRAVVYCHHEFSFPSGRPGPPAGISQYRPRCTGKMQKPARFHRSFRRSARLRTRLNANVFLIFKRDPGIDRTRSILSGSRTRNSSLTNPLGVHRPYRGRSASALLETCINGRTC